MESVPVRCPVCRRDHAYITPVYPCPCGAPTAPRLLRGAPAERITHRTWNDDWVAVRCTVCGRRDQWPYPELCCPCGTVLRIPVRPLAASAPPPPGPSHIPLPRTAAHPRPAFRPMTIRTARDAVAAAALYLSWLGYREVVQARERPASRIDIRATGLISQVDTATTPTVVRDVECLWLNALNASVAGVLFSLAGYAPDARQRADGLGLPLFVMDLTGTPQPVNGPADELISTGA
ncbi:hypothetical protein [Streptomyces fulvorobeus]|uniref:Restriction endonuclease n=1 Tax=Streptomyces fulvorobeus TaxID=284028 RepID=A0A7J0CD67_9ACTN|nr:hypothetical protein [Streptomyces fulvorobeus]NYE43667.1 hypothetical protein [Streptomyces fulvorobeus]GFN00148.1 hypothetical protein Sfulv_49580 [Streptomyces fulvorobeus]